MTLDGEAGRLPISVVVPTRDRPDMLARCLASLVTACRPDDEILVVDSASVDGAAVSAVAANAGVKLLRCERAGASLARNTGWRVARHDLVAFVDDDISVHPDWASEMAEAFVAHPEVSFVSGQVDVPPGEELGERPVAILREPDPWRIDLGTSTGEYGHSANVAIRRAVLEAVGGFDERLGAGVPFRAAEDIDLFDRVLLSGRVGWYHPGALAWHDQWRSRWELVRLDWAYGLGMGVRLTKLARRSPARAARETRLAIWDDGLVGVPKTAIRLYKFATLTVLARVAGTVVGLARGAVVGVADGHLKAPRWVAQTATRSPRG
jgi:glycosyltransferase involved in cell wall biosynthesis